MKVILLEDIKKLGDANDIVDVKPGYARNYLFRKGLAVPVTPEELNRIKTQSLAIQAEKDRKLKTAQEAGALLEGRTYEIVMTVGEEGRLYGSLTPMMLAKRIAEDGYDVDHRDVSLTEVLRTVGTTTAQVRLHTDVSVTVHVIVKGEGGETAESAMGEDAEAADDGADAAAAETRPAAEVDADAPVEEASEAAAETAAEEN